MELRASEDVELSEDLSPPLAPIAAVLHHSSLRSHCSSCFRRIPILNPIHPLRCCPSALRYCSPSCLSSDLPLHLSSAECRLFRLLPPDSDLRLALRLLLSLRNASVPLAADRIAGLMARGGSEMNAMGQKVLDGAEWMRRARGEEGGDGKVERAVLWIVILNGVEVIVDGTSAIGAAVYGPQFSWFNHSCSPNVCYRFEIAGLRQEDEGRCRVRPTGGADGEATDLFMLWTADGSKLKKELCRYGPKIVVRSITEIRKMEEVCITYTDLLQPKVARRTDLWDRYCFYCCCKRCTAASDSCADKMLEGNSLDIDIENSDAYKSFVDESLVDLSHNLEQAVDEYMVYGDAKACCEKVEALIYRCSQDIHFCMVTPQINLKLPPLHHIALKAYMTLASTFKIRMNSLMPTSCGIGYTEALKMARASAAYSLLLVGATHFLFLGERSLMATVAIFAIDAGELLLNFTKRSMKNYSMAKYGGHLGVCSSLTEQQAPYIANDGSPVKQTELDVVSAAFFFCTTRISLQVWPSLTADIQGLKDIENPMDFRWLDKKRILETCLDIQPNLHRAVGLSSYEGSHCVGCNSLADMYFQEEGKAFHQLAIHILAYAGYLARICYGPQSSLVSRVDSLLRGM